MLRNTLFHFAIALLFTSICTIAQGQAPSKGKLAGKILDAANSQALIGATAVVEGTGTGGAADLDGKYIFSLAPGTYNINFNLVGYTPKKITGVVIKPNETTLLNVSLSESANELASITVTQTIKRGSVQTLVLEQKNAVAVSSGVSAEQIRRTPDRTTADVLKRVSGASIQENRFAVVRGLSERYNLGFLNGVQLASTESDRKAFSLDIIPSFVIDKLVITKTATPDMPGDFAGGLINVTTRDIPFENGSFITIGTGFNSITTGDNFSRANTTFGQSLGFVGDRALPNNLVGIGEYRSITAGNNINRRVEESQKFDHSYRVQNVTAMPTLNLQAGSNYRAKLFGKDFGVLGAVSFSNQLRNAPAVNENPNVTLGNSFDRNTTAGDYATQNNFNRLMNVGAILNLSYKFSDYTKLNIKNLYSIQSQQTISERFRNTIGTDVAGNQNGESYIDFFSSNRFLSSQANVEHYLPKSQIRLEGILARTFIDREVPDYRQLNYIAQFFPDEERFDRMRLNAIPDIQTFTPANAQRYYSTLGEDVYNSALNITKSLSKGIFKGSELKAGFSHMWRSRAFQVRNFSYGLSESINPELLSVGPDRIFDGTITTNGFYLGETTNLSDFYSANSELTAQYLMANLNIWESVRIIFGGRVETFRQRLNTFTSNGTPADVNQRNVDFLPSINMVLNLNEVMPFTRAQTEGDKSLQLRFGYARTVNRPEFRELAPVAFFDFNYGSIIVGNPLITRALIDNFDMRLEYYFGEGNMISVGPFYKRFTNPIESAVEPSQTGSPQFNFANVSEATNEGIEFEFRANIGESFGVENSLLNRFAIFSNYSIIRSQVNTQAAGTFFTDRPLQGQSPYVLNAGAVYQDNDKGLDIGLTLNRIGRRIAFTSNEEVQLIWENPRTVLDLSIAKTIKERFTVRAVVGDILAQKLTYYKDLNDNGKFDSGFDARFLEFRNGFNVNLSVNYKF